MNESSSLTLQFDRDKLAPMSEPCPPNLEDASGDPTDAAVELIEIAEGCVERGDFTEAEKHYHRALAIFEATGGGSEHPDTANVLSQLSEVSQLQSRYAEGEELARRAVSILENILCADAAESHALRSAEELDVDEATHAVVALMYKQALERLATAVRYQARYSEAEPLYERALEVAERVAGPDDIATATSLNYLGMLYKYWGRYDRAEPPYLRARSIVEKHPEKHRPFLSSILYNLGGLAHSRGQHGRGEAFCRRSLSIQEDILEPTHWQLGVTYGTLAALLAGQKKYGEAEDLYRRSIEILESALGPDHPDVAVNLSNLAGVRSARDDPRDAESLYLRALDIRERALGPDHPQVAMTLHNLAFLYGSEGRLDKAEPAYRRSLAILERVFGEDHENARVARENLAAMLGDRWSTRLRVSLRSLCSHRSVATTALPYEPRPFPRTSSDGNPRRRTGRISVDPESVPPGEPCPLNSAARCAP